MKAYVFPGQGAQFPGMGKDLFESLSSSKKLFELSNDILGFNISEIMFDGTEQDLKQTRVTQPAIFLHSVILAKSLGENFKPDVVAGHSLGEISALVANECLKFEDGLELVYKRALAMQKACEETPSTMAAILGLEDSIVEKVCEEISGIVVPANYNCPGQLVISGEMNAIDLAIEKLTEKGARRALKLPVGGAFHSPIMETAKDELKKAIDSTYFTDPICPIFQNVSAEAVNNPDQIKENLIEQLTSPVKWTQTMLNMLNNKNLEIIEVGPGKVLQGLFKKIDRSIPTSSAVIS
ncbi:ACP S-malonyltransferase [Bacteroidota bacterium]|nr:ACP S-malonyltransferase [Bacteroidota bacterium]